MSDFSCEPLNLTEIRSIKVDEPFNPCDHTDYGPASGNAPPDFDMLELYKKASPNIFLIQRVDRDIKDPTIPPEVTVGTGFIINSPSGEKEVVTAGHVIEHSPSKISSFRAMRLVDESTHTVEQYYLVPRANQPTNVDAAVLDFDNRNFFLPDAPGLPIGKSLQTGEKIIGVGYAGGDVTSQYVMVGNVEGPACRGFYGLSFQCILGFRSKNFITARQHDEPGNSGSPELNTDGEVVGIIKGDAHGLFLTHDSVAYVPIDSILPYLDGAQ